jgi:8-oxo-dGTP pyrophosphatase MutT (NUDIX family)
MDELGRPMNPFGRTGIEGRGLLGKWGQNPAADPIITRYNPATGKLEMAVIRRGDTDEWAIPGGMVDDGEQALSAAAREFLEETGADLDMSGARQVYRGYVDDPRNTDNAWMETTVMHRHLSPEEAARVRFGDAGLQTGEIRAVRWEPVTPEFVSRMYASHGTFVREALKGMPRRQAVVKAPAQMTPAKLRAELADAGVGKGWMVMVTSSRLPKERLVRAVERVRAGESATEVDLALRTEVAESMADQLRTILARHKGSPPSSALPGWVDRIAPLSATSFDVAVHEPWLGVPIPAGARVIGNAGGYRVQFQGVSVTVQQPTVKVLDWSTVDRGPFPAAAPGVPTIRELARNKTAEESDYLFRSGFEGPYEVKASRRKGSAPGPYVVRLRGTYNFSASPSSVRVHAEIFDANGNQIGTVSRQFYLGTDNYAYHAFLQIDRAAQGSGFAEIFNANLFDWYRRSGITKVKVHANIDVGGYTWARQGFDFETVAEARAYLTASADRIRKALRQAKPPAGLTQQDLLDLQQYVADMLAGKIAASAPDLAQFGRKPGQTARTAKWAGKWLMLGTSWHGVKRL